MKLDFINFIIINLKIQDILDFFSVDHFGVAGYGYLLITIIITIDFISIVTIIIIFNFILIMIIFLASN